MGLVQGQGVGKGWYRLELHLIRTWKWDAMNSRTSIH